MPREPRDVPSEPGNERKRMPDDRSERESPNPRPLRRDREEPMQSDEDVDTPRPQGDRGGREGRDDVS
jgi:hypothetical protein